MQQQQYGYSNNNFGQFQTQQIPQQGYQNNNNNNNSFNNSYYNNPFAPPPGHSSQDYQQNQYNQPQSPPQIYNQGYNQGYNNPYNQPQDQYGAPGNFPPPQMQYQNNNYQPIYQTNNPIQRETIEPSNVFVGFQQTSPPVRKTDDDDVDPKRVDNGNSNWNARQPNQESKSEAKSKPKRQRTSFKDMRRSITSWGTDGKSGAFMTILGLGSIPVILIIVIALMIYHFGSKDVRLSSISGGLNYMVFNLNSHPIMDLTRAIICPTGYEKIHLGDWPGVDRGCSCPIIGEKRGSCDHSDDLICSDVSDIDPIDMYNWDSAYVFCAQRAKLGTDYKKAVACSTGSSLCCPTGYKMCSQGICMESSLECPITLFEINPDKASLTLSRTIGGAPLIDVDISINGLPCFSNTEIPKGKTYTLLKKNPTGCLTYGEDKFSVRIDHDQFTQKDVLKANNLNEVLRLPHYDSVVKATDALLAGRKRITVANTTQCQELDTTIMSNAASAAGNMNRYMNGTAITAMVLQACLFFVFIYVICVQKKNYTWKTLFSGAGAGGWLCWYIVFGLFQLIVFIVMVALVGGARSDLLAAREYLVNLDKVGCFAEGAPRQVIADYDDLVDVVASKLYGFAGALLALTLVSYVPVNCILLYRKCKK